MASTTQIGWLDDALQRLRDLIDEILNRQEPVPAPIPEPVDPPDDDEEPDVPPPENVQKWFRFDNVQPYPYQLFPPADGRDKCPVWFFLHGAGKTGTNNTAQLSTQGPKTLSGAEFQRRFPCFVVAPQSAGGWSPSKIKTLIDTVLENNPHIDRNRIYITGQSMGGGGTLDFAAEYPDVPAAIAPIATGSHGPTQRVLQAAISQRAGLIRHIPFWGHNGENENQHRRESLRLLAIFIDNSGDANYTEYPGVAHPSWNNAYTNWDFLEWMMSQSKGGAPVPIPPTPEPEPEPPPTPQPPSGKVKPHGYYVLLPATRRRDSRPFLAMPHVAGISVRDFWRTANPGPGRFDFSYITGELHRATVESKKVQLRILTGVNSPDWILYKSELIEGIEESIPLPWDSTMLGEWFLFVRELGDRFDSNPAVSLVHMSGPTRRSAEMHLPPEVTDYDDWELKIVAAWVQTIDTFSRAFPTTMLCLNYSKVVTNRDGINDAVVNHCEMRLGDRCAYQHNALHAETPMDFKSHATVCELGSEGSTIGFQMVGTGARLRGTIQEAIDRACDPDYLEIYPGEASKLPPWVVS